MNRSNAASPDALCSLSARGRPVPWLVARVSADKLFARGPVGIDGLLTHKWVLSSHDVHVQEQFAGEAPEKKYTHRDLPLVISSATDGRGKDAGSDPL